ncbi:unnamed protein product [Paramecium pentaurelia]|uniref:Uncharacterized protein n=1 Tax=Paramecium pentaurelia TaxID=43138 RepID=A0A8S1W0F6_9CILI|nr:unnamed protein product [Paramecium pentaurelia]
MIIDHELEINLAKAFLDAHCKKNSKRFNLICNQFYCAIKQLDNNQQKQQKLNIFTDYHGKKKEQLLQSSIQVNCPPKYQQIILIIKTIPTFSGISFCKANFVINDLGELQSVRLMIIFVKVCCSIQKRTNCGEPDLIIEKKRAVKNLIIFRESMRAGYKLQKTSKKPKSNYRKIQISNMSNL